MVNIIYHLLGTITIYMICIICGLLMNDAILFQDRIIHKKMEQKEKEHNFFRVGAKRIGSSVCAINLRIAYISASCAEKNGSTKSKSKFHF